MVPELRDKPEMFGSTPKASLYPQYKGYQEI